MADTQFIFPNVKEIINHLNSLKSTDVNGIKKNIHTYSQISEYLIDFYNISADINASLSNAGAAIDKKSVDAQKSLMESMGRPIDIIAGLSDKKFPSFWKFHKNMLVFKHEVNYLLNVFIGRGGICEMLNAFDVKNKTTITITDDDGNEKQIELLGTQGASNAMKNINNIIDNIESILENTQKLSKNIIKTYPLIKFSWSKLFGENNTSSEKRPGLIDEYINLISSDKFKTLYDNNLENQLNNVVKNINSVLSVIKIINENSDLSDVIGLNIYTSKILPQLSEIFKYLSIINKDRKGTPYDINISENVINTIDSINNIITGINGISGAKTVKILKIYNDKIIPLLKEIIKNISVINKDSSGHIYQFNNTSDIINILNLLNSIVKAISELNRINNSAKNINKTISGVNTIIVELSNFSQSVRNSNPLYIKSQIETIKSIINSMLSVIKDIMVLAVVLGLLIISTPLALLTIRTIGLFIHTAISVIDKTFNDKQYVEAQVAMVNIAKIIGLMLLTVDLVLTELILISLALPVLIKSATATLLTFAIISLVVYGIAWLAVLINKVLTHFGVSMWNGLLFMAALIGVMLITTGMILLLGLVGEQFLMNKTWLKSLAMFAIVSLVTVAMAGLGYLISILLPGIVAFGIGITIVTIAVTAMLLIGVELLLLTKFNFDDSQREAIKRTTSTIIGTARDVMNAVFNGFDEDGLPKSEDNAFTRTFKSIFKSGLSFMVEAFVSSFVLVMTAISVTLMLLIGLELNTLAKYNIDTKQVKDNVHSIMSTADAVIDSVFQPNTISEDNSGKKFQKVINRFFSGLGDIVNLIVAIGKLALTMTAIAFIKLVSVELKWLMNVPNFDKTAIMDNTRMIMSTADAVIDSIFQPNDRQPESTGGWLGAAITHFFGELADIFGLIMSIGKFALTLASIALIKCLANNLIELSDIDTSKINGLGEPGGKIDNIMSAAQACIDAINQPADNTNETEGGFLHKLLKGVLRGPLVDMVDSITKLGKLSIALVCVGMISKLAEQLNTIADIDFKEGIITDKINVIMDCSNICIDKVLHGEKLSGLGQNGRKSLDDLKAVTNIMQEFGSTMTQLSISLNGIDPTKMQKTIDVITTNLDSKNGSGTFTEIIISYVDDIANHKLNKSGYDDNINAINVMIETIKKFVSINTKGSLNTYKEGIDKAIEFTNVISSARLENLQTATNMFAQMAEFSKSINGDFNGLADTINEKLLPLIEDLNKALDKTNESIENKSVNVPTVQTNEPQSVPINAPVATSTPTNYTNVLGDIQKELMNIKNRLDETISVKVGDNW